MLCDAAARLSTPPDNGGRAQPWLAGATPHARWARPWRRARRGEGGGATVQGPVRLSLSISPSLFSYPGVVDEGLAGPRVGGELAGRSLAQALDDGLKGRKRKRERVESESALGKGHRFYRAAPRALTPFGPPAAPPQASGGAVRTPWRCVSAGVGDRVRATPLFFSSHRLPRPVGPHDQRQRLVELDDGRVVG